MHPVDVLIGFIWGWVFGLGMNQAIVWAVNLAHRRGPA
jgi:hypothetical protein